MASKKAKPKSKKPPKEKMSISDKILLGGVLFQVVVEIYHEILRRLFE
jgi:hypothetical protein